MLPGRTSSPLLRPSMMRAIAVLSSRSAPGGLGRLPVLHAGV